MSSVDIQIVSAPNLEKIENFLNDTTYRETIEYSANFNTRLCLERRLRLPFLDPQTGVAQNHCSLYMSRRQRMPGFREGQIYTYPATRWRKSRRQYLTKMFRPFGGLRRVDPVVPIPDADSDFNGTLLEESSSLGGADTSDSKDSQNLKEELPKDWFYDDMDMNDLDQLDEPKSPDDEYDYDPRYGNKKRKKRAKPGRKPMTTLHATDTPRKGRPPGGGVAGGARGRGRRKNPAPAATMATGSGATSGGRLVEVPSPPTIEPPSFESAAAAVATTDNTTPNSELRSYRKYL